MIYKKLKLNVGRETLAAETMCADDKLKPQILVLHGAGTATKERMRPLLEQIVAKTGIGAALFDFSGHGQSTGLLRRSSLSKRVIEAEAIYQLLDKDRPIAIFGFSMGGHIALEMLAHHDVSSLVLFYPGIYTRTAFNRPFDERFTNEIRKPNSWQDSRALDNLESYKGNLLLVWGQEDQVVPEPVIRLVYKKAVNAAQRELLVIPDAPHLLLPLLYSQAPLHETVMQDIARALMPLTHGASAQ